MSFRGEPFAFDSPTAAVAAFIARHWKVSRTGCRNARKPCAPFALSEPGVPPPSSAQSEPCELSGAIGRVLAEPVVADRDSPPFDTSAMDGFAIRAADASADELRVVGQARIGTAPPSLPVGAVAVRIVTGAGIPAGANAVIRREDVEELSGAITIAPRAQAIAVGTSIRKRGENARAGTTLIDAGTVISASSIGTMAAVGVARPRVTPRVRVAIIVTGDELVPPDTTPGAFQLRNSNGAAVRSVLAAHGWIEIKSVVHVVDGEHEVLDAMRAAVRTCDAIVLSGGVSMGHRDPVRAAVEALGAEIIFHGLPQRPGKPLLGALLPRDADDADDAGDAIAIFGLPGNPISAMVTARRIVVPVLADRAGAHMAPPVPRISVANPDGALLDLWWHRLVRLTETGDAELVDGRGSGDVAAGGRSDGFIEVPPRVGTSGPFPFYAWPA